MNARLHALISPLIVIVALNLLPGVTLRPWWFSVFAGVLLLYRYWLHWTHRPMPPRLVLLVGQILAGLAVLQHYQSVFGDAASGTWLALLTCFKLFELKAKRDFFITAILCFLVLMSAMLLDQSLIQSIYLLGDAFLVIAFLFALEEEVWDWKQWRKALWRPMGMMIKVFPLLVLIFLLFPRFSTGFGSTTKSTAKTGMSDNLRPGSVAAIIPSDELIFRATFLTKDVPSRQSLYWRGAVLDRSHGLNWDRSEEHVRQAPFEVEGKNDIEIYLEPGSDRYLFSLENTRTIATPNEARRGRIYSREGGIFEFHQPLQVRERYFLQSADTEPEKTQNFAKYLQVEEPPTERMVEFLKPYRGLTHAQAVGKLLEHYLENGYAYSLQPPESKSVDEFFFRHKEGFCEHFAGSMATILRHLKIPSRVVVGFQGGSPSLLENFITVRGHDAHAWLEYYQSESGRWRRVDPTAQIAPTRISLGSQQYSANEWMPRWVPEDWARTYMRGRALVDEVEALWISMLLRFDLARQKELLAMLGMEGVLFRALPVFLILAIVLVLAVLYFIEAQGREPLTAEEKLYRQFLSALKSKKIIKAKNEGPLTLMERIEKRDAQLADKAEPILRQLVEVRYGTKALTGKQARDLRKQIRAL